MTDESIPEKIINPEKDFSIGRQITIPTILYRLCKKYNISLSKATKEGALMMLRQNDDFMSSTESLEILYQNEPSLYKTKIQSITAIMNKLAGNKE